jgi:spore coat protein CotH
MWLANEKQPKSLQKINRMGVTTAEICVIISEKETEKGGTRIMQNSLPGRAVRWLSLLLALLLAGGCPGLTACRTSPDSNTDTSGTASDTDTDTDSAAQDTSTETEQETEPASDVSGTEPIFSAEGGIYAAALSLSMALPDGVPADSVIRYTADGAVPTGNSAAYEEPLNILTKADTALTVRAACFDADGNRLGQVVTNTYVRADAQSGIWTVMIAVEEDDLDEITSRYNEKVEKPAHVEIVTPAGERVISQDAGLRLFGGSSRTLAQRSFKLIARKDGYFGEDAAYSGKGSFAYPLFAGRTVQAGENAGEVLDRYDSFILRNGGNDSLLHTAADPQDATLIRDGLANNFAASWAPAVSSSLSQFAEVYINGEYYGILDMRENLNEDYVKRVYGVDDKDVVILKSELDTTRHCDRHDNGGECRFCNVWFYYETDDTPTAQAAMEEWVSLCRQAIEGLSLTGKQRDSLYAALSEKIDMESFLQYMALNLYLCNTDWPYNNVKFWKYTGEPIEGIAVTDGKWRFMTRDMDMTFARYSCPEVLPDLDSRAGQDTFWRTLGNYLSDYAEYYENDGETRIYPDSLYVGGLFAFCLKNAEFREAFCAYARTLGSEEASETLQALYSAARAELKPCMAAHIRRWKNQVQVTAKQWATAAARIADFIKERPAAFEKYLTRMLNILEKEGE